MQQPTTLSSIVICLILLGSSLYLEGQTVEQTGNDYFIKTWKTLNKRDTDLARKLADSTRYLYEQEGNAYGIERCNLLYGGIAKTEGNYRRSDSLNNVFLIAAQKEQNTSDLASVYFQLGIVNEALGKLDKAIDMQFRSIEYYHMINDTVSTTPGLNNLGSLYRKLKQYDLSEENYLRALAINKKIEDLDGQATNYVNLGNLYSEQGLFDQGIENYEKAVYLDSLTNFQWGLAYDYENIGKMHSLQKNYLLAEEPLLKSLEIRETLTGKHELALSNLVLGQLYTDIDQLKKAEQYLLDAESYADQSEALETKRDILRAWSALKEKEGSTASSLEYYKQYDELADSILNSNTSNEIARLNVSFETERKEQEIKLLNVQNLLSENKLKNSRATSSILALFLGLFGVMAFMIWRQYKSSLAKNKIISKALSEKEILLKEIHHRVKNNLQFISSLLGLQTEHVEDEAALGALQEGQDRVQSMALIHQNLYQEENLTGVNVKGYFIKLIHGLMDSYNIQDDQIQLDLDIEDLNLDVDTVIPIGLILNELITNSLKYAFPNMDQGTITIKLYEQEKILQLNVKDNGVGFGDDQKDKLGSSFGYRLIEAFVGQLQANLAVDGSSGTEVALAIRNYHKV